MELTRDEINEALAKTDIEVTQEMIEAGESAIYSTVAFREGNLPYDPEEIAAIVYRVMAARDPNRRKI